MYQDYVENLKIFSERTAIYAESKNIQIGDASSKDTLILAFFPVKITSFYERNVQRKIEKLRLRFLNSAFSLSLI